MADATGTYSAEQVERLLTCAICLDRYNSPKILPCQHTFCKSPCLEGLIDMRTRILKCPECRAEHFVPREGADGYPSNISLSGFLDLQNASARQNSAPSQSESTVGTATKCGVCETEGETIKCFHCDKMVCDSCKHSHVGQMKVDNGRLLNQLRRGVPKLSNCISSVEQKSEQLNTRVESVKSEVKDTMERYIKELHDREKMLNSELDTYLQGEQRSLRLHKENLEVELASISSYCDSAESLMNQADSTVPEADLVNIKKQCSDYMEQIRNAESQPVPELRDVTFRYEGQNLHSNIVGLGELLIATPSTSNRNNHTTPTGQSSTSHPSHGRARWSDVEPLDSAFLDDFRISPAFSYAPPSSRYDHRRSHSPPRSQLSNRTQYTRPTQSSIEFGTGNYGFHPSQTLPTPRNLPSRTNDYMFRMQSPETEDLLDIMDRNRRDEISRRRIHRNPLFGRDRTRQERVSGLMGGGGPGAGTEGGWRGLGGAAAPPLSTIDLPPRPIPPISTSQTHTNPLPTSPPPSPAAGDNTQSMRGASSDAHVEPTVSPSRAAGEAASRRARSVSSTANTEARPAAAFIIPLDGGPSQDIDRTPAPTQSNEPPQRRGGRRGGNNNSRRSRAPGAGEGRGGRRQGQPRSVVPGDTSLPAETEGQQVSDRRPEPVVESLTTEPQEPSSSTSNNENNNAVVSQVTLTPTPVTTSATQDAEPVVASTSQDPQSPDGDNQGMGLRSRTFVRDSAPSTSTDNLPRVNGMSSTFDVPLTETIGDLNTNEITSLNTGDSLHVNQPINNYHRKGAMKRKVGGERGNGQGKFTWPRGVAVSPVNDSTIVADSSNHRVQMFDLDGRFVAAFGSYGQADGEFDCLAGVAVNSLGQIIIADRYNHRIQVFDRYGHFCRQFGEEGTGNGQLNYPWGVAVDQGGSIYVCDKENHRIQVFQSCGTFIRKFGKLGHRAGQMENPHYVAVGHDGNVIVSDCNNHRLQVFSDTGRFIKSIGSEGSEDGQLKFPKGVAVDRQGFIVVADSGNNRIQVFRGDGRFFCSFGSWGTGNGQFKGLEGIALTSNGDVVVSDKENHRIQIF